MVFVTTLIHTY